MALHTPPGKLAIAHNVTAGALDIRVVRNSLLDGMGLQNVFTESKW